MPLQPSIIHNLLSVYDTIIIGAGAAGLMCAAQAGKRGRKVLLLDHAKNIGEKIRISGGGRCNFTNLHTSPENFLSNNPHFCVSALKRFTQHDFIALVEKYSIDYQEKTLGQLFCNGSAKAIIEMLVCECNLAGVKIGLGTSVHSVEKNQQGFVLGTTAGQITCESLVIATGGPSIPKMGATG
jgi:predicted Rossmann fold flavoprotein